MSARPHAIRQVWSTTIAFGINANFLALIKQLRNKGQSSLRIVISDEITNFFQVAFSKMCHKKKHQCLQKRIQITMMNAWDAIYKGDAMEMLTVRNLPDDAHRALRLQAALHGHSTEAEVREILAVAVKPEARVCLGDALAALGRKIGLTNEDFDVFIQVRDKTPAQPLSFE